MPSRAQLLSPRVLSVCLRGGSRLSAAQLRPSCRAPELFAGRSTRVEAFSSASFCPLLASAASSFFSWANEPRACETRTFASLSLKEGICGTDATNSIRSSARLKRIMYRSKQRGWAEIDLLLGAYADQELPSMSPQDVDEFEKILEEENVVLYDSLIGKDFKQRVPAPAHLADLKQWKQLSAFIEARRRSQKTEAQ
ncbi:TPR repeat region protein [Besnoitia besnoiti]|uniref:TPR repeat region protein n=1 Tax=Besnoitia besnoiti TaxID=94643 RepID=A0A2A9M7Q8_BESBE|nr:TPR repeat region protein [Besnoitia besnoiti]PFH33214.1 TPR repeat region protein [Besnoitia besnoiti]